ERRVDIGCGLGRFDHRAARSLGDARADLRQLDVNQIAELLGGHRGNADRDCAIAVVGDPFVRGGVFQALWQLHGSSKACSTAWSMPPLSVCLRNWRSKSRSACSFGEAARAFSPERP